MRPSPTPRTHRAHRAVPPPPLPRAPAPNQFKTKRRPPPTIPSTGFEYQNDGGGFNSNTFDQDQGDGGGFVSNNSPNQDVQGSQGTPSDNKKVRARASRNSADPNSLGLMRTQGNREKQSLLPVTIKQLVDAENDGPDDVFKIDGVEVSQVLGFHIARTSAWLTGCLSRAGCDRGRHCRGRTGFHAPEVRD